MIGLAFNAAKLLFRPVIGLASKALPKVGSAATKAASKTAGSVAEGAAEVAETAVKKGGFFSKPLSLGGMLKWSGIAAILKWGTLPALAWGNNKLDNKPMEALADAAQNDTVIGAALRTAEEIWQLNDKAWGQVTETVKNTSMHIVTSNTDLKPGDPDYETYAKISLVASKAVCEGKMSALLAAKDSNLNIGEGDILEAIRLSKEDPNATNTIERGKIAAQILLKKEKDLALEKEEQTRQQQLDTRLAELSEQDGSTAKQAAWDKMVSGLNDTQLSTAFNVVAANTGIAGMFYSVINGLADLIGLGKQFRTYAVNEASDGVKKQALAAAQAGVQYQNLADAAQNGDVTQRLGSNLLAAANDEDHSPAQQTLDLAS